MQFTEVGVRPDKALDTPLDKRVLERESVCSSVELQTVGMRSGAGILAPEIIVDAYVIKRSPRVGEAVSGAASIKGIAADNHRIGLNSGCPSTTAKLAILDRYVFAAGSYVHLLRVEVIYRYSRYAEEAKLSRG
jgi:hypothetical protein